MNMDSIKVRTESQSSSKLLHEQTESQSSRDLQFASGLNDSRQANVYKSQAD
jgi:hypothetical protein